MTAEECFKFEFARWWKTGEGYPSMKNAWSAWYRECEVEKAAREKIERTRDDAPAGMRQVRQIPAE